MNVDLMGIVRSNHRARKIILDMNIADMCQKYQIDLSQAKKLKNYAALLEAATPTPQDLGYTNSPFEEAAE